MRRLLVVLLVASLGLPLIAAAPPSSFFSKPNVIVFPFTSNSSGALDREASSRLATIIATAMADTGKVTVTPPPPGTERKDYLTVTRAHRADYYVSGFISPLGDGVSIVEQVVSAATGIVVYSQSAQLKTYNDAAGQGDDLAAFVATHANRGLVAIGTAPPQSSPTPAASPEANLGKLFGRRKKAAPKATPTPKPAAAATAPAAALINVAAPTPTPRPVPTAAPRPVPAATAPQAAPRTAAPAAATPAAVAAAPAPETYAVLPVGGSADAALRELATTRLAERAHAEQAATAAAACAGHTVHAVLAGTLSVRPDPQFGGASATFELTASDCSGKTLWHQTHGGDAGGAQGQQIATERAVESAIGAYLNPPKRRR